jgi:hypothetical protein
LLHRGALRFSRARLCIVVLRGVADGHHGAGVAACASGAPYGSRGTLRAAMCTAARLRSVQPAELLLLLLLRAEELHLRVR